MSTQVSAYFDGDLAADEELKLRAWLLESPSHVNDFVVDCFVHTQLVDLLSAHQLRANALVAAEALPKPVPAAGSRRVATRILALAVSVVFVSALMYFVMSRPVFVATISGTSDVKWMPGAEKRTVGSLLQAGNEVAVDRGTLHLTFARGGQVVLHGPARFRVDSDAAGRLLSGSLSAFVPEHAVGFTVRTGKLTVVDLGTEFHIDLSTDESAELQVFSGLVELQFDAPSGSGAADKKLQISQGRAIRFDAASRGVKTIGYNKTMRLPMSAWSQ